MCGSTGMPSQLKRLSGQDREFKVSLGYILSLKSAIERLSGNKASPPQKKITKEKKNKTNKNRLIKPSRMSIFKICVLNTLVWNILQDNHTLNSWLGAVEEMMRYIPPTLAHSPSASHLQAPCL